MTLETKFIRLLYSWTTAARWNTNSPCVATHGGAFIRTDPDTGEIPIYIVGYRTESPCDPTIPTTTLEVPIYHGGSSYIRSSISFLDAWQQLSHGVETVTFRNDVYYIGKGILFDRNKVPLIVVTLKTTRISKTSDGVKHKYELFHTPTIHISPRLLTSEFSLLRTWILNYVLPLSGKSSYSMEEMNHYMALNNTNRQVRQYYSVKFHELETPFIRVLETPALDANISAEVNTLLTSPEIPDLINSVI